MTLAETIILIFAVLGYLSSAAILIEKSFFVTTLKKFSESKNLILFVGILETIGGLLIVVWSITPSLVGVLAAICGVLVFIEGMFLLFLYEDYKISLMDFLCNDKKIMITASIVVLISTFFLSALFF